MDMTILYLVRHGETVDNARHIMQGQTQGQLNDNGIRQAEEVADIKTSDELNLPVPIAKYETIKTQATEERTDRCLCFE